MFYYFNKLQSADDLLRRYAEGKSVWNRALAIVPDDVNTKTEIAGVEDALGKPTFDPCVA